MATDWPVDIRRKAKWSKPHPRCGVLRYCGWLRNHSPVGNYWQLWNIGIAMGLEWDKPSTNGVSGSEPSPLFLFGRQIKPYSSTSHFASYYTYVCEEHHSLWGWTFNNIHKSQPFRCRIAAFSLTAMWWFFAAARRLHQRAPSASGDPKENPRRCGAGDSFDDLERGSMAWCIHDIYTNG